MENKKTLAELDDLNRGPMQAALRKMQRMGPYLTLVICAGKTAQKLKMCYLVRMANQKRDIVKCCGLAKAAILIFKTNDRALS